MTAAGLRRRGPELRGERVLLRRWLPSDHAPFAALNADPAVMEHLPRPLHRNESTDLIERIEAHFEAHGFGLWALAIPGQVDCAGFVGLSIPRFEAPFTPCVEIGWRLARACWGQGFAREAAELAVAHAFSELRLDEIVSFTSRDNLRSRRLMERLGMRRDPAEDFEHPLLPEGHRLRGHVLYRLHRDPTRMLASPGSGEARP